MLWKIIIIVYLSSMDIILHESDTGKIAEIISDEIILYMVTAGSLCGQIRGAVKIVARSSIQRTGVAAYCF